MVPTRAIVLIFGPLLKGKVTLWWKRMAEGDNGMVVEAWRAGRAFSLCGGMEAECREEREAGTYFLQKGPTS